MSINRNEIEPFSGLELLARQVVEGFITGLHKSPFHGFSVEFAEHRLYNTGESTRHLDWKLYARTEKLFVKRYEEETNLRCRLIIDHSSSMYFPDDGQDIKDTKVGFSVYAAAAIIQLLKKQRDAYGISLFNDQINLHTEARSNATHRRRIYHELEMLLEQRPEQKRSRVVEALHQIAEMVHKRSLIILFSDMLDDSEQEEELFAALQHLKYNKHEVILFHVMDHQKELDFDFENRPYRFVDMESGESVKLNPSQVKEAYVAGMKEKEKELKLKCGQYGIDFVPADLNEGFHQVLLPYLLKRTKMQ